MNYVFKMIVVVLALGVLVLQGCQTTSNKAYVWKDVTRTAKYKAAINDTYENDKVICYNATDGYQGSWTEDPLKFRYVNIANNRGLNCGVNKKFKNIVKTNENKTTYSPLKKYSNKLILSNACSYDGFKYTIFKSDIISKKYVEEALQRNLYCSENHKNVIINEKEKLQASKYELRLSQEETKIISKLTNSKLLQKACTKLYRIDGEASFHSTSFYQKYVIEAKKRGLSCGIEESTKKFVERGKNYKIKNEFKPTISSAALEAERKKRLQLERELAEIKNKQKQEQQRINTDNQIPTISAFTKQNGSSVTISGRVTDNTKVAEVLVDGQAQQIKSNGTFETPFYIPRTGKTIEIIAFDVKGNKASKFIKLERDNIQQANVQKFKSLNPSLKRVKLNPNALALIIGISDYENTNASALYADSDAKMFYDYANLKLGIPSSNIKELVGNNAKRLDIFKSVRSFLLKRTVTNKTDIYVFFAGHGLATADGKGMYLLPFDGDPEYLEDSAIKRKKLFKDIQATKPRKVTVFLDTCYSGGTRNDETLVASLRPIIITAKEQSVPDNFTILSAAKGNQTSQSLAEVKHGLFSYYTMLGMEGGADTNNDNKITARELHAFIKDKVERQSQFRQTPELQGDKDRILIQFN